MIGELVVALLLAGGFAIWLWALITAVQRRSALAFVLVLISGPIGAVVYLFIVVNAPPPGPPPGPPR